MCEAAGAFDAWGSSLISAVVGAIFVVVGVVLAQRYIQRSSESDARMGAADALTIEVANLRDAATRSHRAFDGSFQTYPLRNALYVSRRDLYRQPVYDIAGDFYDHVSAYRDLIRGRSTALTEDDRTKLVAYHRLVIDYGDKVINLLQLHIEDKTVARQAPPPLPTLSVANP